jgi:hypothetical protein
MIFYRMPAREAKNSVNLISRTQYSPCHSRGTILDV